MLGCKQSGFFFVQTRQNSGSIKTQGFGITQGIFTKTQGRFYQNSDFGIFNNFAKYCLYFIYYKRRAKIVNIAERRSTVNSIRWRNIYTVKKLRVGCSKTQGPSHKNSGSKRQKLRFRNFAQLRQITSHCTKKKTEYTQYFL